MPIPTPPPRLSQTPARLAYSDALQQSKSNQDEDAPASAHRDAHTRSRHARADPAASSSPRAAAAQQRLVADIRIIMPSSPFAVSSGGSSPRRTASMDQYPSGSTQAYSPSSPGSPATTRRSDGCASPSSPSKSPLRHTTSANSPSGSGLLSDFRAASQHLLGATATPGRRQALYTACTIGLNAVSIICITFFAVSWYRTYSFNAARTDLITTLRYILLILAPLALWCLPTMCAISALMAWPHSAPTDPAHIPGASPPDDASPISFRIPAKPRSFEAACSDAYATAAASEELLHDIATPRFGFTVHTDPQHDITDGAVVARPRPLTAQDFADACIEGAHRVADSFSSTVSGDHRRPLLPASGKPRGHRGGPGCGGGCCVRTCAIAAVWLRHEVLLAVLCALAGYGTLMLVLFDQNVLTRSTGVAIMTQSPPHLRRLAWSCSTVMFGLYSVLLTSDCICAVLSVWCGALLRRHRGRTA